MSTAGGEMKYAIDITVTDNAEMDDQSAQIFIHGVTTPEELKAGKLIYATKVTEGPQVYIPWGIHPDIPQMTSHGWPRLIRALAKRFNLSGKARITWKHEGAGRPRGKSEEFDI